MSKKIFVTGTGTDIGKTYVTALIVKKLREAGVRAAYYKAAMSGNSRRSDGALIPGDALCVRETAGLEQPLGTMCPYVYEKALSPHLAAAIEGRQADIDVVVNGYEAIARKYDYITMEGSGGIVCPVARTGTKVLLLEDIIKKLGMSCLIVADSGLGTINSTMLTVFYMRSKNIPVKGIIFNHFHPNNAMEEDNLMMCRLLSHVEVIACVQDGAAELPINAEKLVALYE